MVAVDVARRVAAIAQGAHVAGVAGGETAQEVAAGDRHNLFIIHRPAVANAS